ncbi:MAG: DNA polymerase I [Candidatus Aureabacteria bacterium]|nr:DNA polymerase I [Candidatus Auribacterota bacterium]
MRDEVFLIIDGMSFVYRAFYAIRDLKTASGFPTNAIFGFVNMLERLLKDYPPDYIAVAFDTKEPTFRHKKYEGYKATRKPIPDDLIPQIDPIKQILRAYNIKIFECPGYEADDVLATLAKKSSSAGIRALIATGDKDMMQLVDGKKVFVLSPGIKENILYDPGKVLEKFGVGPERMLDLLSLTGDSSDNISGVPGIGIKTAQELLNTFGSLDNILNNIDKIKSPSKQKIFRENRDKALFSRELIKVDRDVPVDFDFPECSLSEPDKALLSALFRQYEFKKLAERYIVRRDEHKDFKLEVSSEEIARYLESCRGGGKIYFKTLEGSPGKFPVLCVYNELAGPVSFALDGAAGETAARLAGKILEDGRIKKIGFDLKSDIIALRKAGIGLNGIASDVEIAAYVLNPSLKSYSIDSVVFRYMPDKALIPGESGDVAHCCSCLELLPELNSTMSALIKKEKMDGLYRNIELKIIPVLADMEFEGIRIDRDILKDLSAEMKSEIAALKDKIFGEAGREFNINSTKQLGNVLFEDMGLPILKKTKTGFSTDDKVLEELEDKHPVIPHIRRYRILTKLISTYIDALPALVDETARLHTTFNQTGTATGRLSSSNPNLQNIPVKTEDGRKIRKAFIPREGWLLLSCDYSQIELRVLAHLSGDEKLIKAFEDGMDIHAYTAALINDIDIGDVTDELRQSAKAVNFGIIYGISPFGLSKNAGIGRRTASEFIENYYARYKKVKVFIDDIIKTAEKQGFIDTISGRKRYIAEFKSSNPRDRHFAERIAVNTKIQGSAADIIKAAMVEVSGLIYGKNLSSRMILQVHDELIFEVPPIEAETLKEEVKNIMENVFPLNVPLKVSMFCGKNWADI